MYVRVPRNLSTPPVVNDGPTYSNHGSSVHTENIIVIIIGILSVFANIALLYVMYKDPLKTFRTKISYLVICLGTADLLTAFNGVVYGFLSPMKMYHQALWYIFWVTVMVSVFTIFGMCVERCLAILYPFTSGAILRKQLTLYFCIGIWIVCAAVSTSIHFFPKIAPFVLTCLMEVLLLVIVVLYLVILRYFKQVQRQTNAVEKVTPRPQEKSEMDIESGKQKPKKFTRRTAIETQLLIVVSILVVILFVTFIPYNLGSQIHYGYLLFNNRPNCAVEDFIRYFFPIKFLNFLVNPFVYAWRLDQYRQSFALVICDWSVFRTRVSPNV